VRQRGAGDTLECELPAYAEGYCVANDFEQAQGRVFQAMPDSSRAKSASPMAVEARPLS
jgi:hypothetical protein